jgi:hypothetical protein
MSANQSKLSSTGFDYVVAVTQESINATLQHYLYYSGLSEVILCYVYDAHDQPQPIDFTAFLKQVNNIDPFTIPNATPVTDTKVQALNNANFAFAIKAKLGLPPGVPLAKLPPIIALKPSQTNVAYTLMFAEFAATEIVFGRHGPTDWFNQSQPSGTSWTFSGAVELNFQTADFAKLPPAVQQKLKGIADPSAFSVQQLYYDLNSSSLQQGFQFNKMPSNSKLNEFMTADFINTYWKALKAQGGGTILGYGAKQIKSPSLLSVTDLNHFVPQPVGSAGAPVMLNYLCATNGHSLPGVGNAAFSWNWLENGNEYHGVAAINRNALAQYLNSAIIKQLTAHCYRPTVGLGHHWEAFGHQFGHTIIDYSWNMESGQQPTVDYPGSDGKIIHYLHTMEDKRHQDYDLWTWGGGPYDIGLKTTFEASVSVQGSNQLVIVQHLIVWLDVRSEANEASGNVVDTTLTDTFTISADSTGKIVLSAPSPNRVDKSETPGVNGFLDFWAPVNQVVADLKKWQLASSVTLTDVKLSDLQDFVFPGGAAFSPMDASFSDNQDLVAHFKYVNPS